MANETDEQGTDKATDGNVASASQAPQSAAQKRAAKEAAREAQAAAPTGSSTTDDAPDSTPPTPPTPPAPAAPTFTRERLLGIEGELITGHPHHVIAGALAGSEDESLTREQVSARIDQFLTRPVSQED